MWERKATSSSEYNCLEFQIGEIQAAQAAFNTYSKTAQQFISDQAERLAPLVLGHFNTFIRTGINPKLPKGFAMQPAEKAEYVLSCGKFDIMMGYWTTPRGSVPDPRHPDSIGICFREIDAYKKATPWVNYINPHERVQFMADAREALRRRTGFGTNK